MADLKKIDLKIPNLGEAEGTEVIEIPIKVGDKVGLNDPLIVLESEKAAMEVPSDYEGTICGLSIKEGDSVSEGDVYAVIEILSEKVNAPEGQEKTEDPISKKTQEVAAVENSPKFDGLNAGPAVRKIARELEIDISKIPGTGKNSLITKEDLKRFIHSGIDGPSNNYADINKLKKFGSYQLEKQSKIKKLGAQNLYNSWISVPHVTHFEDIDITDLELSRKKLNESSSVKITPLSYLVKYASICLKEFPIFNSSLVGEGEIMIKEYINIGIAIDTDSGLVVPNIKNTDLLSEIELAEKISTLSNKAQNKKIFQSDLEGATFTISSLGMLGGTGFTPIINPPEVAIFGISRTKKELKKIEDNIEERVILPVALSYDHRVINGADAGRFMNAFKALIECDKK